MKEEIDLKNSIDYWIGFGQAAKDTLEILKKKKRTHKNNVNIAIHESYIKEVYYRLMELDADYAVYSEFDLDE